MAGRKSLRDVQETINAKWPGKFRVLAYSVAAVPAGVLCLSCNTKFESRISNLVAKGVCPHCGPGKGSCRRAVSEASGREAGAAGGVLHLGVEPIGSRDRRLRHSFFCPKHGKFSLSRPGQLAQCPKCRGHISPNAPENLPPRLHGRACDLYLVEIRDTTGGYYTKVGISTNWEARKRNYAKDGVTVLREVRMLRMTLYEALVVEREIKRWMRRVLGRRKCPPRRWSGWSESALDPQRRFPAAFDREVAMHRARRRA